jgi:uncharacterized protein (DUF1499 family)
MRPDAAAASLTRRACCAAALALALPWARPPALAAGGPPPLACPQWKPTESGCVSTVPSGAPNQNVSPLRYSGERERAYSRLRACLLAKPGAELISDEVPSALKVRLPSLEPSQPGLQEELSFSFLADEPVVTVRILAERSYASQPFCVQPGCIVGNAAQRRRLEAIRDEVGWNVANEPTDVGKWVPLFFNQGISLDPGEEAEARPRQRCTFYGCKEVGGRE